jgi:hypothetical protein
LCYPRLVLGISGELPPDGDIEWLRRIGKLVRDVAWARQGGSIDGSENRRI